MSEQDRRESELDRVAPATPEIAGNEKGGGIARSDDPAENQERALESGEENPI